MPKGKPPSANSNAITDEQQEALLKIKEVYNTKAAAAEIKEAKGSVGFMRYLKSNTHTVKAKTIMVNGKKVTHYVGVSSTSNTLLCKVCAFPMIVTGLLIFLFLLDYFQQMPPIKLGSGCNSKSTFEMPPEERPVFDNCEWCEENCAECIACYDGKTVFYEEDMDRCERIGGPCGYPFGSKDICTQTCSPVMVKGAEGLHCVEGSASFSEMMLNEAFCQARDPSLATIYGVDPVGGPGYGRVAPNLYLPKGYTDPANANKSWPLLMTLTGRETCGASFYWYTGLRPIAYEKGFMVMFPDSIGGVWCASIDTLNAATAGSPHCNSPEYGYLDDAAYIASLIAEVQRDYRVAEVFTFGWSNGASFSMLMACYFSDIITASVAYAGGDGHLYTIEDHPTYKRGCTGLDAPIHLLLVHDPIDPVVTYSNAAHNMEDFAAWNGCATAGCPEEVGTMDLMPLAKGWISWVPNLIKYLEPSGANRHRIVNNETQAWRFHGEGHSCAHGGSAELWTMDSWGADTNWYMQGHASSWGDFELPGVGHMIGFGDANDVHEHHALARRSIEWMQGMAYLNTLPADAEPTEADEDWQHGHTGASSRRLSQTGSAGINKPPMTAERIANGFLPTETNRRQMPMFTVKSLEGHVHEDCPHWANQKHQMLHNIYTILFYVAFPFIILLMCCCVDLCLCVSWMRQHHIYKKFIKQETKRGFNAVRASMKLAKIGKQPAERML